MGDESLQGLHIYGFLADELQEKLIYGLIVGPGRVNEHVILLNGVYSFWWRRSLLQNGQWSENVLFDHLYDQFEVGQNDRIEAILIIDQLGEFLQVDQSFVLE